MEERRGRENRVSGYWGRVMGEKKKEKGMYTRVWCLGRGSGMGPTKSRKY